ncbi:MAG: DUF4160 domain-containing protein [Bacteroidetes bacterium]|nr:DUF4160 domain-containing protein [Bacteroidota bacterium]
MPTIDMFDGIKINIYNGDHRPPHVHVVYNEFEILLTIESQEVYVGELPSRQLKKAMDWLAGNANWALEVFYELNPDLR